MVIDSFDLLLHILNRLRFSANLVGEQGGPSSQGTPRLAAYAYYKTHTTAFADRAIRALAARPGEYIPRKIHVPDALNPLDEAPFVSTNTTAQTSLQTIEILEMCKDQLPTNPLPPPPAGFGRGGGRGAAGN